MGNPTFMVQAQLTDPLWSVYRELVTVANALGPYTDHMSNLAIWNKPGSGKVVRILRATCSGSAAGNGTTVAPDLRWQRCSVAALGREMLTPIKMRSDNDNLPSQVKVYGVPSSVTLTADTVFYQRVGVYPNLQATAFANLTDISRPLAQQYEWPSNTNIQKITLREGEGLCLHTAGVVFNTSSFEVTIRFRKASNGHTYQIRYTFRPDSYPAIALMNEASSGVVLEVTRLAVQAMGTGDPPWFSCEKIDALDESTGIAAVVGALDSTMPLPADIIVQRRARVKPVGTKDGAWIPFAEFAPRGPANPSAGPANVQGIASGLGGQETVHIGVPLRRPRSPRYEVVVREGEGFAWMQRSSSSVGSFDIGFVFIVEDMAPKETDVRNGVTFGVDDQYTGVLVLPAESDVKLGVGYGANGTEFTGTYVPAGAVYPDEDDVRDGVVYGPTGSDFEGDIVMPAEADVKLGVSYGADGTEYTGTYEGGGGGGKRRIRGVW